MEPINDKSTVVDKEPIAFVEAVRALILAIVPFCVAFNIWNPTRDQVAAILGLLIPVSALLSLVARMRSTPNRNVALTNGDLGALVAAGVEVPKLPNQN